MWLRKDSGYFKQFTDAITENSKRAGKIESEHRELLEKYGSLEKLLSQQAENSSGILNKVQMLEMRVDSQRRHPIQVLPQAIKLEVDKPIAVSVVYRKKKKAVDPVAEKVIKRVKERTKQVNQ